MISNTTPLTPNKPQQNSSTPVISQQDKIAKVGAVKEAITQITFDDFIKLVENCGFTAKPAEKTSHINQYTYNDTLLNLQRSNNNNKPKKYQKDQFIHFLEQNHIVLETAINELKITPEDIAKQSLRLQYLTGSEDTNKYNNIINNYNSNKLHLDALLNHVDKFSAQHIKSLAYNKLKTDIINYISKKLDKDNTYPLLKLIDLLKNNATDLNITFVNNIIGALAQKIITPIHKFNSLLAHYNKKLSENLPKNNIYHLLYSLLNDDELCKNEMMSAIANPNSVIHKLNNGNVLIIHNHTAMPNESIKHQPCQIMHMIGESKSFIAYYQNHWQLCNVNITNQTIVPHIKINISDAQIKLVTEKIAQKTNRIPSTNDTAPQTLENNPVPAAVRSDQNIVTTQAIIQNVMDTTIPDKLILAIEQIEQQPQKITYSYENDMIPPAMHKHIQNAWNNDIGKYIFTINITSDGSINSTTPVLDYRNGIYMYGTFLNGKVDGDLLIMYNNKVIPPAFVKHNTDVVKIYTQSGSVIHSHGKQIIMLSSHDNHPLAPALNYFTYGEVKNKCLAGQFELAYAPISNNNTFAQIYRTHFFKKFNQSGGFDQVHTVTFNNGKMNAAQNVIILQKCDQLQCASYFYVDCINNGRKNGRFNIYYNHSEFRSSKIKYGATQIDSSYYEFENDELVNINDGIDLKQHIIGYGSTTKRRRIGIWTFEYSKFIINAIKNTKNNDLISLLQEQNHEVTFTDDQKGNPKDTNGKLYFAERREISITGGQKITNAILGVVYKDNQRTHQCIIDNNGTVLFGTI